MDLIIELEIFLGELKKHIYGFNSSFFSFPNFCRFLADLPNGATLLLNYRKYFIMFCYICRGSLYAQRLDLLFVAGNG